MDTLFKTKQDILGQVALPKIKGSFDIAEEKLKEPLFYEGSVIRCFCFGCGVSTEITVQGAEHLVKSAGVDMPLSWQGFYFVSQECIVCGRDFTKVIFKKIP